jgi:hypothetical protein
LLGDAVTEPGGVRDMPFLLSLIDVQQFLWNNNVILKKDIYLNSTSPTRHNVFHISPTSSDDYRSLYLENYQGFTFRNRDYRAWSALEIKSLLDELKENSTHLRSNVCGELSARLFDHTITAGQIFNVLTKLSRNLPLAKVFKH